MSPDVAWLANMLGLFVGFCVVVGFLVWLAVLHGKAKAENKILEEQNEEIIRIKKKSEGIDQRIDDMSDDQLDNEL